ncbi:hypothetical protein [uncultured Shewanella sp.]|uniref:hypothetical protein n=1 Tax=uncultured Shewanella sp. TaxID=173975 RepID=UPI00262C62CF|nr:hypothetical protein [uncultured Shewanella sp.]
MFAGVTFLALFFQLAMVVGIIVFAVKLLNRISEIASAQQSIAESQLQLIKLLNEKQTAQESKERVDS